MPAAVLVLWGDGVADYTIKVKRSTGAAAVIVVLLLLGGGIILVNRPTPIAGNGQSVAISVKVVPTIRSVTVTPSTGTFTSCSGGDTGADTASTSTELGYPNGQCWDGKPGAGNALPFTITYRGPPGKVYVMASNALPNSGGGQWSLCTHTSPCAGSGGLPGANQFVLENFGNGSSTSTRLTDNLQCDQEFGPGGCSATQGRSQQEGFELVGPQSSDNTAQVWTVTITWGAAPLGS
jgi:hypothetical protein